MRNLWVTETALTHRPQHVVLRRAVATFAIAMGVALLLTGIGLLVLTLRLIGRPVEVREPEPATSTAAPLPG